MLHSISSKVPEPQQWRFTSWWTIPPSSKFRINVWTTCGETLGTSGLQVALEDTLASPSRHSCGTLQPRPLNDLLFFGVVEKNGIHTMILSQEAFGPYTTDMTSCQKSSGSSSKPTGDGTNNDCTTFQGQGLGR